jgi:hypothetical protein
VQLPAGNTPIEAPVSVRLLLALPLLASHFVYHTFEKFVIRIGKKATEKTA